ncbi:MAG: hypothetical protein AB7U20_20905 [Planctomycetaceae bacterium]
MVDIIREIKASRQFAPADRTHSGLGLLYRAYHYAVDVCRDPWEFAVEIDELRASGMNHSDFRWLLCKGYLQHAREVPCSNSGRRQFASAQWLSFHAGSCFQLTETGLELAGSLFRGASPISVLSRDNRRTEVVIACDTKPKWDGERHQFFVREQLVKEFKVPSPNQETILTAFEEENWPVRIDDPLSPTALADGKRRLHDTIKSLNRNQKRSLIRFMGDGTGEGVLWELTGPELQTHGDGR